jgi:hypothetical protein
LESAPSLDNVNTDYEDWHIDNAEEFKVPIFDLLECSIINHKGRVIIQIVIKKTQSTNVLNLK